MNSASWIGLVSWNSSTTTRPSSPLNGVANEGVVAQQVVGQPIEVGKVEQAALLLEPSEHRHRAAGEREDQAVYSRMSAWSCGCASTREAASRTGKHVRSEPRCRLIFVFAQFDPVTQGSR